MLCSFLTTIDFVEKIVYIYLLFSKFNTCRKKINAILSIVLSIIFSLFILEKEIE
jgi:hypothetical protein